MGKMFRLTRHLNLFLPSVFGSWHFTIFANTWLCPPAGQASLHRLAQNVSSNTYMVMLPVRWWKVGSILNEGELPFPFPFYRYVIYLWLDSREWGGRGIRRDMFRNCCICVTPAQYEYNQYIYVELLVLVRTSQTCLCDYVLYKINSCNKEN